MKRSAAVIAGGDLKRQRQGGTQLEQTSDDVFQEHIVSFFDGEDALNCLRVSKSMQALVASNGKVWIKSWAVRAQQQEFAHEVKALLKGSKTYQKFGAGKESRGREIGVDEMHKRACALAAEENMSEEDSLFMASDAKLVAACKVCIQLTSALKHCHSTRAQVEIMLDITPSCVLVGCVLAVFCPDSSIELCNCFARVLHDDSSRFERSDMWPKLDEKYGKGYLNRSWHFAKFAFDILGVRSLTDLARALRKVVPELNASTMISYAFEHGNGEIQLCELAGMLHDGLRLQRHEVIAAFRQHLSHIEPSKLAFGLSEQFSDYDHEIIDIMLELQLSRFEALRVLNDDVLDRFYSQQAESRHGTYGYFLQLMQGAWSLVPGEVADLLRTALQLDKRETRKAFMKARTLFGLSHAQVVAFVDAAFEHDTDTTGDMGSDEDQEDMKVEDGDEEDAGE
jgi:hypothetical protein